MDYQTTREIRRPSGNRDRRFAPQGAYRATGEDSWVALSVQSDTDWERLCELIGRSDLRDDPELRGLAGRIARHNELDKAIEAWTSEREQYEAAWELQRAGISAAPILAN